MIALRLATALAAALLASSAHAAQCPKTTPEAVAAGVSAMYDGLMARDDAAVQASLAPGFQAFDGGKRFTGPALVEFIKGLQASGKTYVWSVAEPAAQVMCDRAFITYTNTGSITDTGGTHPTTWLESAFLVWQGDRWRMQFLHSTRVLPAP